VPEISNPLDVGDELLVVSVVRPTRVQADDEERETPVLPIVGDGDADGTRRRVAPRAVLEGVG
jgi:hypothetical protein